MCGLFPHCLHPSALTDIICDIFRGFSWQQRLSKVLPPHGHRQGGHWPENSLEERFGHWALTVGKWWGPTPAHWGTTQGRWLWGWQWEGAGPLTPSALRPDPNHEGFLVCCFPRWPRLRPRLETWIVLHSWDHQENSVHGNVGEKITSWIFISEGRGEEAGKASPSHGASSHWVLCWGPLSFRALDRESPGCAGPQLSDAVPAGLWHATLNQDLKAQYLYARGSGLI